MYKILELYRYILSLSIQRRRLFASATCWRMFYNSAGFEVIDRRMQEFADPLGMITSATFRFRIEAQACLRQSSDALRILIDRHGFHMF